MNRIGKVCLAVSLVLCLSGLSHSQDRKGGFKATTSQNRAREIMGTNFFGVEEATRFFGVNPTRREIAALAKVPFSRETLEGHKHTHILVAVFPLSILEIRGRVARDHALTVGQDWYNNESFAKDRGEASWQLIRKTPVENSTSKDWHEQQALLSKDEETPTARVMVYTTIGHFLATSERLFEHIYVRCSDVDSGGNRVRVGRFDTDGLFVGCWDGDRCGGLGVASARKSD